MVWLAVLTAFTLVGQYVMLGNTGIGQTGDKLPTWFWTVEKILWGLRALVEVGVVVYIGMTNAQSPQQEKILWWFKAGLIILIVITVGPVWGAYTLNETITGILQRWGVIIWGMLLAGISATMLAGVSYAYRAQPFDAGLIVLSPDDHQKLLADQQAAITRADELSEALASANADQQAAIIERDKLLAEREGMREAISFLQLLPPSSVARLIAQFAGGQRPQPKMLADSLGLAESTIRGVYRQVDQEA
jgi:hypothetical protein